MLYKAPWALVCYTAVFSVVTQRGGTLQDDTKNGYVADYLGPWTYLFQARLMGKEGLI